MALSKPGNHAVNEWRLSLHDPFKYREVRQPSRYPIATQCSTYHGFANYTTNGLGFARVVFQPATGAITVYNDATHTDLVLGAATTLVAPTIPTYQWARICSAGLKMRSTASFANEGGVVQSYSTLFPFGSASYDVFRDSPHLS